MTAPEAPKRLRILLVWGSSYFDDFAREAFLNDARHDFEILSGNRSRVRSPHAPTWRRLLSLRRRLRRGEFDLVVSGPVQNTPWPTPKRLATRLAQAFRFLTYKRGMLDTWWVPWLLRGSAGKVPLAVLDFLDTSYVLPKDFPLLQAATLYFKINLYFWPRRSLMPLETFLGQRHVIPLVPKLRPLTHGIPRRAIPDRVRPMAERDIDICFTGTIIPQRSAGDFDPFPDLTYNPVRRRVYEQCKQLEGRFRVFCLDGLVPTAEYRELLQRTRLVVCTESFGCETWRHYDVAASGAVPLVNWPYAENHRIFEPDVHAVYFSLIGDDFERVVARALADPARLERIAQQARAFTLEHKTRPQIGEHVIRETMAAASSGPSS